MLLAKELLVVASDNLLNFSLTKVVIYALKKGTSCIMRYFESLRLKLQKSGVVTVDKNNRALKLLGKTGGTRVLLVLPRILLRYKRECRKSERKRICRMWRGCTW